MPQFEQISTFIGQIFWLSIFFIVLLLVLQYRIIPRLNAILERRSSRIERMLKEASIASSESEAIKKALRLSADKTNKKAHEILEETKDFIRQREKQLNQELYKKLESELLKAQNELEQHHKDLISQLPDLVKKNAGLISDTLCIENAESKKPLLDADSLIKAYDKVVVDHG